MSVLETLIPAPDLLEIDHLDVAATPDRAFALARRCDLARAPLLRLLFAIRTLPSRLRSGDATVETLTIDDIVSTERPGFRLLSDSPREVVVGAIGKVWKLDIPFIDVRTVDEFVGFSEPGYAKVAWAMRAVSLGEKGARLEVEVRVSATDDVARDRFRRYFRLIGPGSHFIRRQVLASVARELGSADATDDERSLPGDDLLPDAGGQTTHGISIEARPQSIWPWLVQMGCRRAGWYSYDFLDNAGIQSAREIHPELQEIAVGDVLPATPGGDDGFEVLHLEPPRLLILGGLFDSEHNTQLPFGAERPERYWHVTWAFVLDAATETETRLLVRARAAFPTREKLRALWIGPVHHFMQTAQLRRLKARAEGSLSAHEWSDVVSGAVGAAGMVLNLMTPFLGAVRSRWGLSADVAERDYPGDELVPEPRWSWTHGVEIEAPPEQVWPWVAQVGADRGGFYTYQWLENLAGCKTRNAETIHPEWELRVGDGLLLHPNMPAIPVVAIEPGRHLVVHALSKDRTGEQGRWVSASWLFFVEPLPENRSRLISRVRSACSDDIASRLLYGPYVTESVGFVMDRRMLLGVKERAERQRARRA
jgi:hypothetical protein